MLNGLSLLVQQLCLVEFIRPLKHKSPLSNSSRSFRRIMFMDAEVVHQLMFVHEDTCSCSACGASSKSDVEGGGGKSIGRAVKRIVKNWAGMRDLSVQLTPTTAAVLAFEHGKLAFSKPLIRTKQNDCATWLEIMSKNSNKKSADGNLVLYKKSLNSSSNYSSGLKLGWPFGLKGTSQRIQAAKDELGNVGSKPKTKSSALSWPFRAKETSEKYASCLESNPNIEVHKSAMGWPLQKISSEPEVTRLPERSVSDISTIYNSEESCTESSSSKDCEDISELYCSSPTEKLRNEIHRISTHKTSHITLFTYDELRRIISDFSPGNLIGIGGSSSVYKGSLPNGKLLAVKIFRSYKEACEDFFTEINITATLSHKSIVPLTGVCLDQDLLVSVYDFLPQGSLEEHLHGCKRKPGLPWEARFKISVAVAEALMYLHDESPRPVIHRDVTSSNILLSDDFHPQLSDFGIAMWRQTSENNQTVTRDVLGTFGYIAPEYFMHGKVSDKIDVYSFGVVLLELLSGRRPVNLKAQKGHESLVKWARRLIDCGDVSALLDPKLGDKLDASQIHAVVLAAYFCTSQTDEQRPGMRQICELLKGEISATQLIKSEQNHSNENCSEEQVHLSNSVLKIITDLPSRIRPRLERRKTLSDCLQEGDQHFTLADLLNQED